MISSLYIENFKCFGELRLPIQPLTLLTGFNSAGKSSFLQPLLLLAQAEAQRRGSRSSYSLNGPLVRLGTAGEVLPVSATEPTFKFTVSIEQLAATWTLVGSAGDRHVDASVDFPAVDVMSHEEHEARIAPFRHALLSLSYISAVREGLADSYPMPDSEHDDTPDVGTDGRFAAYWYNRFVDEEVPIGRRHPSEEATSFRKQADAWFSSLFPAAQINVQHLAQIAAEGLRFRLSDVGDWRRPANVGYGFSYAFPILIALLTAREGQVVVIDSPEAHLHPRAQSEMGRMLAVFAAAGVRVVVETHSDHLLNGVRLAVKEGLLEAPKLAIHFFTGATIANHGVVSPVTDREGRLSDWPDGFFDQAEKDLAQLMGWS